MEKQVTVVNDTGLHARPAAAFVKAASKYKCSIKVFKDGKCADAKSIMGILSLGVTMGSKIKICTDGIDEESALNELVGLIEGKFGEA